MEDVIRVGVISTVNSEAGTAQVYYPDRDSTTDQLHLFAFNAEYAIPAAGEQVVVLHLSNDTSSGVILGRFWGSGDPPPAGVDYRKDLGFDTYEVLANEIYSIHAPELKLEGEAGSMTLSELIRLRERVEALERRG